MATQAQIVEMTNKYLIPNYGRVPVAMARGAGGRIWDADGKEYVDLFAGFGAGGVLGHCHPAVVAAIREQAGRLLACGNLFTNEPQAMLAKAITDQGFGGKVFFCHSGAEANEAALKLARLAAGPGRYKIVSFHGCFHGRTMGALSLTPEKFQKGFEPMLPGNVKVSLGDIQALRDAIDEQTAAVIVEPIQGEGGMNIPSAQFMKNLRALCNEKQVLLVCDEVWTAPARTGKWYGYQLYGIQPDIMTLGKALGGGGVPVAACVAAPKYQDVLQPGTHGCTLGGNPLCAAAGLAAMRVVEEEDLLAEAERKGHKIMDALAAAKVGCVRDIRGRGVMIGVELDKPGKGVFTECLQRGVLINVTQDKVVRLAPPIVIEEDLLEKGVEVLIEALRR